MDRHFVASAPDRLWVANITYVPTWVSFLCLGVVLDGFRRRVIGWSMVTHNVTVGRETPRWSQIWLPDIPPRQASTIFTCSTTRCGVVYATLGSLVQAIFETLR